VAVRTLIAEDDPGTAARLIRELAREGYAVDLAGSAEDALWCVREHDYDAVVLKSGLPDPGGLQVCRTMRAEHRWAPILLLTPDGDVTARVAGLDSGADDCLTAPFVFAEFFARLRAITRREAIARPVVLQVADLTLNPVTHSARRGAADIILSPREFALLRELMKRPGGVLSRTYLIDHVWDFAYRGGSNVVDVYVRYLRDKVDRPFGRETIRTVRGVGYLLDPDA